ncbi:hypothetical protein AFLA_000775 [Aspergillus flavus NRRL3357]|nr:hypothetical protein AFLA_000775 [Aspergillus flavus NRRL3357]
MSDSKSPILIRRGRKATVSLPKDHVPPYKTNFLKGSRRLPTRCEDPNPDGRTTPLNFLPTSFSIVFWGSVGPVTSLRLLRANSPSADLTTTEAPPSIEIFVLNVTRILFFSLRGTQRVKLPTVLGIALNSPFDCTYSDNFQSGWTLRCRTLFAVSDIP